MVLLARALAREAFAEQRVAALRPIGGEIDLRLVRMRVRALARRLSLTFASSACITCTCPTAQTGARSHAPMQGARTTRTPGPSFAGNAPSRCSAPAIAQESESHTRTVTGGGGISPSFTTSKCA